MNRESFENPFVQKMKLLTNLLVVSVGVNVAFLGTFVYNLTSKEITTFYANDLPVVSLRKEHSDLLQQFFQMNFDELVLELSNHAEVSDGYKVCDLALAILSTYHYLDLGKALMGESLEEREVTFIHKDGGERFSLSLYPDVKEYHYTLIKGFIKEVKYPFTSEGLFAKLKVKKEGSATNLVSAFMYSKEFIAIYTFMNRFFENLPKEKLLLTLIEGGYKDIERFYYLYLENMDKPKEMVRYFLKTYTRFKSKYAAEMWLQIDEEYILHQLSNEEIAEIVALSDNENFLKKINEGVRSSEVRKIAEEKLHIEEEPQERCVEKKKYTVQSGDSLWKIANKHQVSISAICEENHLTSDVLRIGQVILLPKK